MPAVNWHRGLAFAAMPRWQHNVRLIVCGALAAFGVAQQNAELRGTIVGAGRSPVSSFQVVLRGPGVERTAGSDGLGNYHFSGLLEGVYEVAIVAGGFYSLTVNNVSLHRGQLLKLPPVELIVEGIDCGGRLPRYLRYLGVPNRTTGALGGMVVDDRHHAIDSARIALFLPESGIVNSATTDRAGYFSLTGIPVRSNYRIEIVRGGYYTEQFTDFQIQAGYETVYNLDLQPCSAGGCQPSLRPVRVLPSCA
jgi:hypothetical protein